MGAGWLDKNRGIIFMILLAAAAGGIAFFYWGQPPPSPGEVEIVPAPTATPALTPTLALVRVDVAGAVLHPDVYALPQGSIVKEAILAAGGFTADADPERINQAQELKDQQQLYVPRKGEANKPLPPTANTPPGLININTATQAELETLPGIGPAIAERIIAYRESHGGFTAIEEVAEVSGIGEATFADIKDKITVE
jgi:competence protein ComEA